MVLRPGFSYNTRMMRSVLRPLPLSSLVLTFSLAGAVIPAFSLESLADHSQSIVEGTVIRSWSGWDAKHSNIWTHYEIRVSDWIRGPGGPSTIVSEPGGSLDGLNQQVSGAVQYEAGEHVLLFLYTTPIGFVRATGAGQGKLTIAQDGRIILNLAGLVFSGSVGASGTPPSTLEGQRSDVVKATIRRLAGTHPYKGDPRPKGGVR
jgi:hypothetical protein